MRNKSLSVSAVTKSDRAFVQRLRRFGFSPARAIALAAGLMGAAALGQPSPRQPSLTLTHLANRPGVTYAYAIVDPHLFRISVKAFAQPVQMARVRDSVVCNGLTITGGFTQQSGNRYLPEGLIRSNIGPISPLAPYDDGGVLSIRSDGVRIIRIGAWRSAPLADGMALQTKPLLVFDGQVDEPLNRPERWNRVAIGTLANGKVVFLGAFTAHNDALTFRQFAQDAKALLGSNLVALLNMDGGPSAFIYSSPTAIFPGQGAVTSYVCAEPR